MSNDFVQFLINSVHALWESHKENYKYGYSVFYGPVRSNPDLMLIGLNPGIEKNCPLASGSKEIIYDQSCPMEYLTYRNDKTYPIAGKTVQLFESIGMLNMLSKSVKTNLNFFKSKKWAELNQQHAAECTNIINQMLITLKPKSVLCESIHVFDTILSMLSSHSPEYRLVREEKDRGRRIYISASASQPDARPAIIIGITHLTGSRPTNDTFKTISELLKKDLCCMNDKCL